MLREALIALLREKDFDAISVQDITGRARVHRGTFYLHYRDKDELITQTMKEMLAELAKEMDPPQGALQMPSADTVTRWFQHASAHAELYHIMLGRSGMRAFATQMRGYIEKLMAPQLEAEARARDNPIPVAIQSRFLASAHMGVMEWWLERGQPLYSAEEMGQWLLALTGSVLHEPVSLPRPR
jgi:AcrR family transcriptional regulator